MLTTACNSGTSCIVTKKGELFVFGKDSSHADFTSGQVTDLNGHVITQCGREFPPGPGRTDNNIEGEDGSDHDADNEGELVGAGAESMCPPGKHKWKHDQCMVRSVCGECTGYGAGCVSASGPDRNPKCFVVVAVETVTVQNVVPVGYVLGKQGMMLRVQDKMEQGLFQ